MGLIWFFTQHGLYSKRSIAHSYSTPIRCIGSRLILGTGHPFLIVVPNQDLIAKHPGLLLGTKRIGTFVAAYTESSNIRFGQPAAPVVALAVVLHQLENKIRHLTVSNLTLRVELPTGNNSPVGQTARIKTICIGKETLYRSFHHPFQ